MPTGQTIINAALSKLGILGQASAGPSVSDSTYALGELQAWSDAAQIDDGLIFAELAKVYALTANVASYPIGPTQASPFNVARPTRLFKATMLLAVGSSAARRPLSIVSASDYYGHGDLKAAAEEIDEAYLDFNCDPSGNFSTLYLWPVPKGTLTSSIELVTGAPFVTWDLTTNYSLTYGMQDMLQKVLAFMMIPTFGAAVDQNIAQLVTSQAAQAETRMRKMNMINRQIAFQQAGLAPPPTPPQAPAAPVME